MDAHWRASSVVIAVSFWVSARSECGKWSDPWLVDRYGCASGLVTQRGFDTTGRRLWFADHAGQFGRLWLAGFTRHTWLAATHRKYARTQSPARRDGSA